MPMFSVMSRQYNHTIPEPPLITEITGTHGFRACGGHVNGCRYEFEIFERSNVYRIRTFLRGGAFSIGTKRSTVDKLHALVNFKNPSNCEFKMWIFTSGRIELK